MAIPLLAKTATSLLSKKVKDSKKEKVSPQKLLNPTKQKKSNAIVKVSNPQSGLTRKVKPINILTKPKTVPTQSKGGNFDMNKLNKLLDSLVKNTSSLEKVAQKDAKDEKKDSQIKASDRKKLKSTKREEKTETKKVETNTKKQTKMPKMPSLFKDIMGMGGRLLLSVGIMQLLKFMTDTDAADSIFGFLEKHIDKIAIGFLGMMAAVFTLSFLPVIGLVGTFLGLFGPIIFSMAGFLLSPMVIALIAGGYAAGKQGLGKEQKRVVELLEEQANSKEPFVVFSEENKNKLIERYKKEKENLNPFQILQGVGRQIDNNIKFLETGEFGYGDHKFKFDTGLPIGLDFGGKFDFDTGKAGGGYTFDFNSGTESDTEQTPQAQPQSPMMGDAYGTGLKTGPSQYIGGSSDYHIDTKLGSDLSMEEKIKMMDQLAKQYESQGRIIEFSNDAVANEVYTSDMSMKEKRDLLQRAFAAHNLPRGRAIDQGGFNSLDYYIPLKKDSEETGGRGRFRSSAEGAEIFVPVPEGGSLEYHSGGNYGNFVVILDKDGNVVGKTGHGDTRFGKNSGTVQFSEQKPKDPNVSSRASYEETGTQIALLEVPVSTPSRGGGGGGGSPSGSTSGDDVNRYTEVLALASHYREA